MARDSRYILTLAVAAGLILVFGWLLKPEESVSEPVSAPSQVELSRLPSLIQRRSIEEMAEFFSQAAETVAPTVVRLRSVRRSGVVWSADRVVTARLERRFPVAVTVAARSGDVGAYANVAGPDLPLAAMRTPQLTGSVPARTRPAESIRPGEWLLAAWQGDAEFAFAPGNYIGHFRRACGPVEVEELATSLPVRPAMIGGGVFDLDANLVGMVLRCDAEALAVTTRSIAELLAAGETHDGRLRARWGLRVAPLNGAEAFYFELGSGLIVREVWDGYPVETAGLRPGDILVSLDGAALREVEQLRILDGDAAPDQETFSLEVRRGGETVTVTLPARGIDTQLDAPPDTGTGLVWEQSARGYLIASVLPGSLAWAAGIEPGDRVVRVDLQEPATLDAVRQVLADDRAAPTFIEFTRDGRSRGVLLP